MIVIIVFIIVLGIIAVHFGFQSKKEQRKNKSIACIYVGDKKSVWILGNISFWGGTLEGILLLAYFCSCFLWRNGELHYFFGIIFVIPLFFCMMEKFAITIR